jgi:3-oxoadipate enol-lactonase
MPTALTDDGVNIEYQIFGSGPLAVFFQHGWGNAASFWDNLLTEHLNLDGLRCITVSYRGHGGSSAPAVGYTHERFARDMFAVADAVGAGQFVNVGFSMAGKFARYMAYLQPRRIIAQVLIAPPGPEPLQAPREAIEPWVDAAPYPQQFGEILKQFIKRPVAPDLFELYCNNVARASRAALKGTIDMLYESILDQVKDFSIPTLVLAGEGDPLLHAAYAKAQVLPTAPGARLVTLPCGHEIPIEMPAETAWILEGFLAGLHRSATTQAAR